MRNLFILLFLAATTIAQGQNLRPQSVYVSYFGETVTHPGLRVGASYQLKAWEKTKTKKSGKEKLIHKSIDLSPSVGFYYHKDYQTGIFVLPELSYSRKNVKGNYITFGIGAGYMRTFIPSVYEQNSNGDIEKINGGYNYFVTNYSIAFGKDLSHKENLPDNIFIKPQLLNSIPNYSNSVWAFALELGVSYKLTKK